MVISTPASTRCRPGFDGVQTRFDGLDQRFELIDQRFDRVDQRFDYLDRDVQTSAGKVFPRE